MNGYEDTAERKNDLVHHQHGSTIQSPAKSDHLSYAEKLLKNVTETTQLTKWMQQQSNLEPLSSEILHLAIKLQCPIIILQLLVEQMKADVNYQMNVFERRAAELIYPVEAIIVANKRRRFNQNSNVDDLVVSSLQYLIEKGASKISKSRALHLACAQGRLDCVKALVEDKREDRCDINDVDVNGNTPILASALHSSNTQCIEILLEHGADINYQNHQGNTILHKIVAKPLAKSEYNSIISYLLAKGCNVNTANAQGDTPLIKATRQGNTDIVKLLLDHLTPSQATTKNVKGYTALHEASLWNFVDIVQLLLDKGFDVNSTDQLGNTPLHIVGDQAFVGHNTSNLNYDFNSSLSLDNHTPTSTGAPSSISSFQKRTVELLLKHGADVKAKNTAGDTPLHNMRVSLDKTALLVESGAELEATNQKGETPLLLAVMHGKIQHVEYLLQNGAKIDSIKGNLASLKDEKGNTVAHYAAASIDHLPLLKLLLKEGEFGTSQQINTPNAEGNTLLHVACMNDAKEVIDLLLQSPIDAKAKNNEGKTAFDVALAQFSIQSIVTLHQKGLGGDPQDIIKRRDGDGNSLLHRSVKTCAPEYSRALIRIGINVNVTSDNSHEFADGGTPLHFAAQVDNPEMVEMLLEEGADSNNNANYEGNTPLHVAAKFGNSRALAVLLKQGADATRLNNDEESVMQAAEFGASEDCIQMLQGMLVPF